MAYLQRASRGLVSVLQRQGMLLNPVRSQLLQPYIHPRCHRAGHSSELHEPCAMPMRSSAARGSAVKTHGAEGAHAAIVLITGEADDSSAASPTMVYTRVSGRGLAAPSFEAAAAGPGVPTAAFSSPYSALLALLVLLLLRFPGFRAAADDPSTDVSAIAWRRPKHSLMERTHATKINCYH